MDVALENRTPDGHTGNEALVQAFLSSKSRLTMAAYAADLTDFAGFFGCSDPVQALSKLVSGGARQANLALIEYKTALAERGLKAATINRHLSAVRSLLRLAKALGVVDWTLVVQNLPVAAYRDTRGPSLPDMRLLLVTVAGRKDRRGIRDFALLRLLYDCALRRNEAVTLDLEHLDIDRPSVQVLRKGRLERLPLTLAGPTAAAIRRWILERGDEPGPLFVNFDRARKGSRLTGVSVNRIVAGWGRELGLRLTAHQLRHAGITHALDATGGDVRAVARFSGLRQIQTLIVYDDNRTDFGGQISGILAAAIGPLPD